MGFLRELIERSSSVLRKVVDLVELVPDDSVDYSIDASHEWGLPGVRCDVCGATWGKVGVSYPTADLSSLPNSERFTDVSPVTWGEFVCGRQGLTRPHQVVVDRMSIPEDQDIFRLGDLTTMIVASRRAVVAREGLRGYRQQEVALE
jgi:hypothetical protein